MNQEQAQSAIPYWAIVEVMGHGRFAGQVAADNSLGFAMLRIDVPAVEENPAFTRFLAPSSLFAVTPTDEHTARRAAAQFRERPVVLYDPAPRGRLPNPDDDGWEDDRDA